MDSNRRIRSRISSVPPAPWEYEITVGTEKPLRLSQAEAWALLVQLAEGVPRLTAYNAEHTTAAPSGSG